MERTTERPQLSDKQKLLYKHYSRATFAKVLALLEQEEDVSTIARDTGLKRQDVDKIKAWPEGSMTPVGCANSVVGLDCPICRKIELFASRGCAAGCQSAVRQERELKARFLSECDWAKVERTPDRASWERT